ncbi:MAG: hypothetical protein HC934_10230 [Acaryochloridaceae cyanobacterium SU_2_1]|nr:hypothetical protein [Acaryochloridaceae cyanobacterium SU_2_1]
MYAQFRTQYPTGSLTSELLQVESDRYIVRAEVRVGEITLASGFAAAATIEAAEDRARQRALVVLGVEPVAYEAQAHLLSSTHGQGSSVPARLQPSMGMEDLEQLTLEETLSPRAWDASELPESKALDQQQRDIDPLYPTATQPERSSKAPATNGDLRSKTSVAAKSRQYRSGQAKASAGQPAVPKGVEPLDLSEILAQTDVELKRLGWSNAQGRKYLQQTYDKRSRQHLTDDELLEFLDFLQAQTTEEEAPF